MLNAAPDASLRYGPSLALIWLLALVAQFFISSFDLDYRWAELLYQWEGGGWRLRDDWLLTDWIHQGGRSFSILLALICILFWLVCRWRPELFRYRRVAGYLALSPLLSAGLVSLGKQMLGGECPWSLQPFGGDHPYRPLLAQLFAPGEGGCFPAGHASAGYAWLALWCAAIAAAPRFKGPGLLLPLLLGGVFGVAQQLRGAHFLSHDLWSLTLCWTVSVLLARVMLGSAEGLNRSPAVVLAMESKDGYECAGSRR